MKLNPDFDPYGLDTPVWQRGQFGGTCRPINREVLFKNLCEIHKVLNENGITHWLSHGTVLGVYRENNFIEWDDDADFSYYFSDRNSLQMLEALDELRAKGFYIPPSDPSKPVDKNNSCYYDLVFIKDGEKCEGWGFEKIGNEYIYDLKRSGRALAHPAHFYDTLDTIDFKGVQFNTPNNLLSYLTMMYGSNFMVPDPNKKYNEQV